MEVLLTHIVNYPPRNCRTVTTTPTHRSFLLTSLVLTLMLLSFSRLCQGNAYSLLTGLSEVFRIIHVFFFSTFFSASLNNGQ